MNSIAFTTTAFADMLIRPLRKQCSAFSGISFNIQCTIPKKVREAVFGQYWHLISFRVRGLGPAAILTKAFCSLTFPNHPELREPGQNYHNALIKLMVDGRREGSFLAKSSF